MKYGPDWETQFHCLDTSKFITIKLNELLLHVPFHFIAQNNALTASISSFEREFANHVLLTLTRC